MFPFTSPGPSMEPNRSAPLAGSGRALLPPWCAHTHTGDNRHVEAM